MTAKLSIYQQDVINYFGDCFAGAGVKGYKFKNYNRNIIAALYFILPEI
jgi:adenine-specific DNA methylase